MKDDAANAPYYFDVPTGLNKAAVLQVDARGAVNVRRWDAGEDDRAQGALAARVRGALWRHRSRLRDALAGGFSVWKSRLYGAFRRRVDGVAMPVPHRSTEQTRPRSRREMT